MKASFQNTEIGYNIDQCVLKSLQDNIRDAVRYELYSISLDRSRMNNTLLVSENGI